MKNLIARNAADLKDGGSRYLLSRDTALKYNRRRDEQTSLTTRQAAHLKGGGTRYLLSKRQVGRYNAVKMVTTPRAKLVDMASLEMQNFSGQQRAAGNAAAQYNPELGGQLSPNFVEWLMGYPKDWTCLTKE